jgi:hypothetical protein
MNSVKIEIEVPEELLLNLKQSDEEFKKEINLTMAVELYKNCHPPSVGNRWGNATS